MREGPVEVILPSGHARWGLAVSPYSVQFDFDSSLRDLLGVAVMVDGVRHRVTGTSFAFHNAGPHAGEHHSMLELVEWPDGAPAPRGR